MNNSRAAAHALPLLATLSHLTPDPGTRSASPQPPGTARRGRVKHLYQHAQHVHMSSAISRRVLFSFFPFPFQEFDSSSSFFREGEEGGGGQVREKSNGACTDLLSGRQVAVKSYSDIHITGTSAYWLPLGCTPTPDACFTAASTRKNSPQGR